MKRAVCLSYFCSSFYSIRRLHFRTWTHAVVVNPMRTHRFAFARRLSRFWGGGAAKGLLRDDRTPANTKFVMLSLKYRQHRRSSADAAKSELAACICSLFSPRKTQSCVYAFDDKTVNNRWKSRRYLLQSSSYRLHQILGSNNKRKRRRKCIECRCCLSTDAQEQIHKSICSSFVSFRRFTARISQRKRERKIPKNCFPSIVIHQFIYI